MVRLEGLEPSRLAPLPPQDSVSTNSTTIAFYIKTGAYSTLIWTPMQVYTLGYISIKYEETAKKQVSLSLLMLDLLVQIQNHLIPCLQ